MSNDKQQKKKEPKEEPPLKMPEQDFSKYKHLL
jgi:hypothetical protein